MKNTENIQDKDITLAIEEELRSDESVKAYLIDVQTKNGIVTMSGTVDNLRAKEQALRLVEAIKGVRSIIDHLTVKPVTRSDEEILRDITRLLFYDPVLDGYRIATEIEDGRVTLTGKVDSWQARELAGWIVKEVKGVKVIKNEIKLEFHRTRRLDSEIEVEIKYRFAQDVWLDDALIAVQVKYGKVILSGTVGSLAEKTRARSDAWVGGVIAVDYSRLEVDWQARNEMRRENEYGSRSDVEIERAVKDAFLYDPRLFSLNPEVTVSNGAVILTGKVDNLQAKKAAEQDAKNTIGVWRVKNYLKVRPANPSGDADIVKHVQDALLWAVDVDLPDIAVSVHNGVVSLHGSVASDYEKTRAEEVAGWVRDVVEVKNRLKVEHLQSWKEDWEIEQDIERRLAWSPYIDAKHITVTVQNGVAELTGSADTWHESSLAVDKALKSGAKLVNNHLQVKYGPLDFEKRSEVSEYIR